MIRQANESRTGTIRQAIASLFLLGTCLGAATAAHSEGREGLPSVSSQTPWEVAERNEDPGNSYVMYVRRTPGSNFNAYRLEAVIDAPPSEVAAAARHNIVDPEMSLDGTVKQVLRDEGDVHYVYSYINLPVVSDRDVITRSERFYDAKTGEYRVEWSASDEGPAPKPGVVRLTKSRGSWVFAPLGASQTRAVYENYTDIGGMIPAWIVNPMMTSQITSGLTDLRTTLAKTRARAGTTAANSLR